MDVFSVVSSVSMSSQQQLGQAQTSTKVEGRGDFHQQLNQYVNQTDSAETSQVVATNSDNVTIEAVELGLVELSSEELIAMIEGLLEQIEELNDAPLIEQDKASLELISLQLLALLQLIAVDNQDLTLSFDEQVQPSQAVVSAELQAKPNNELLMKLQDQLLLLQQVLKDGSVKVVQGQQPEQLVANALNQLKQVVTEAKGNAKEQLISQLNSDVTKVETSSQSLLHATLDQLKQLAKQGEYSQLSNQASTIQPQVVGQTTPEVLPVAMQQMNVVESQVPQTVSFLKAQPQAPAFTMVNQFADTVKTMVFQKFDFNNLNGMNEARIMLTPEHLGGVDIKISMQNGILTAVFQTETALAKDALENQMAMLRSSLAAQGITVERLEVSQASFASELNWQEQRHQQQSNKQSDEENLEDENFEEQLELNTVIQELGYGRAVNEMI